MKTILCYGDSKTWGWDPASLTRFGRGERWPGVLQQEVGEGYEVIEEGLPGRTTVWDDPVEAWMVDSYMNGRTYLLPCLGSHKPIDLVIILLGTNDLKGRFSLSAFDIAEGVGRLVDIVLRSDAGPDNDPPRVLLVAPPPLGKLTGFADMFDRGVAESAKFSEQYRRVAELYGCDVLDAGEHIVSSDIDGVHFELSEHHKLGLAVAARVRGMLE